MVIKDTFRNHAHGADETLPSVDVSVSENSQQWSANATSQTELLAREGENRSSVASKHKTAKQREEENKQRAALLQAEAVRQAYEQFQDNFDDAMEFYDAADERLDDLEERINERLNEMESETELLTDDSGNAVYQDENGGFYKVENGQRIAITAVEEVASLKEKIRDIKASGQTVRTESEQDIFVQLQLALTETMDIRRDAEHNRDEAEELKREVERDHSKAPDANERLQKGRDDIEKRMKEMEKRVDGLDATKDRLDKQQTVDQAPESSTINDWKSSIPTDVPPSPPTGL